MNKQKVFGSIIISGIVISSIFCNASAQADSVKGGWGNKNSEWQSQWDVKTFFRAIQKGDIAGVKSILSQGLNPNHYTTSMVNDGTYYHGMTPLMLAAMSGHKELVNLLIETGSCLNAKCHLGYTAMDWAVKCRQVEVLPLLSRAGASVKDSRADGGSLLNLAVEHELPAMIRMLVRLGADVNEGNNDYMTPLMRASALGHVEDVKALLALGANVNAVDKNGKTPLIRAAMLSQYHVAKLLIDDGACTNILDKSGKRAVDYVNTKATETDRLLYTTSRRVNDKKASTNALYQAAVAGNTEVVKLALQSGANPNAACGIEPGSEQKLTALMAAVKNGHTEIVDLLLQAGANLYADNEQGDTALSYAVESGQVGMVQRLYESGASLQPMGRFGLSPLMHACSDKSIEAAKFLLSLRVNVNEKAHTGITALMRCVNEIGDNRKMASFLIKAGADVNAVDKDGRTALMDAAWYGDLEMVKLLVEHGADIELEAENGDYAILCAEKQQHAHVVEFLKKTIKQKNQHRILDCK